MSFTDTSNAKRYASIAEVAAAQCKMYTEEARMAPEYTDLAKQYADSSKLSAEAATSAAQQALAADSSAVASASSALSSAESASNDAASALSSAASASESADIASGAVNKTLRVSDSDISPLPNAADRAGKVLTFDASGNAQVSTPASGSATDVLIELAKPTGASLIGYEEKTVADICGDVESILLPNTRELWARTVSEAGFVLVDGSFESGATISTANQALWYENGAQCYWYSGELPKLVPEGSTPESTGGISTDQWVSVEGDGARNWVKSNIGLSDTMDELISNLNTVGAAIIHGTHEVPVGGLGLPVASTLTAVGQRVVQFSGDLSTVASRGYFTKSNNTSVAITNPNTSSDNETLDTIAYVNTETLGKIGDNEIWGSGVVIRDSAFRGTAPNMNDAGIFVLNGGYHIFENVQVVNTKFGFKFGDVYLTNLIRCHTSGAIQQMGGTSTHYDNVWARGHLDVVGAFHFEGLNYSVLDSICSDRPRRGFLYLKNCVGLTFNSAATEGPGYFGNLTEEQGGAAIIDSGNRVTFNNLQISPISSYTGPLISIGNDNNVIIDRLFTNNGVAYTSADLYVHGDGSFVEIKSARVRVGRNMPLIHIKPGSTSKVVVWLNGGNRAILTAGETKETPFIEYEYKREAFNPILLIGESSTGITYLGRSGSWSKAGNMVTVNFTISLSSKGNLSGNLSIGNLPFNVPANTGGILLNYANMANGPFSLGSVTGGPNISIRRSLATATIIATNSEINNDSIISGSITYQIASSIFNSMPS